MHFNVTIVLNCFSFCSLQLSIFQVKAEMEKTLKWLVPVATNTIR